MKKFKEKKENEKPKEKLIENLNVYLKIVRNHMEVEILWINILKINTKDFGYLLIKMFN